MKKREKVKTKVDIKIGSIKKQNKTIHSGNVELTVKRNVFYKLISINIYAFYEINNLHNSLIFAVPSNCCIIVVIKVTNYSLKKKGYYDSYPMIPLPNVLNYIHRYFRRWSIQFEKLIQFDGNPIKDDDDDGDVDDDDCVDDYDYHLMVIEGQFYHFLSPYKLHYYYVALVYPDEDEDEADDGDDD